MKTLIKYINVWLPSVSVIVSALVSYCVAKLKSKDEIKKLLLGFDREDKNLFNETFSKLLKNSIDYIESYDSEKRAISIEANSLLMTMAPKSYLSALQSMDIALTNYDYQKIQAAREQLIKTALKEKKETVQKTR